MKTYKENVKEISKIKSELKKKDYPMAIIHLEFIIKRLKMELKEETT